MSGWGWRVAPERWRCAAPSSPAIASSHRRKLLLQQGEQPLPFRREREGPFLVASLHRERRQVGWIVRFGRQAIGQYDPGLEELFQGLRLAGAGAGAGSPPDPETFDPGDRASAEGNPPASPPRFHARAAAQRGGSPGRRPSTQPWGRPARWCRAPRGSCLTGPAPMTSGLRCMGLALINGLR